MSDGRPTLRERSRMRVACDAPRIHVSEISDLVHEESGPRRNVEMRGKILWTLIRTEGDDPIHRHWLFCC